MMDLPILKWYGSAKSIQEINVRSSRK